MSIKTISEVYSAINPIPAMLTSKGKVEPEVSLEIRANAEIQINMNWIKDTGHHDWDRQYKVFTGTADQALEKALAFIAELPDAKTARLHAFMAKLGAVIDDGRAWGVDVAFINPLTETMKRLANNAITHKKKPAA
jgi:hypothetical protein